MNEVHLSIDDVRSLTLDALVGSGTSQSSAEIVTRSIVASELDGIHSHGLARLPTYCEHVKCGKLDGAAVAAVKQLSAGAWQADTRGGFAHPAIELGFEHLISAAGSNGIASLAVINSYNCGVLGYHVEALARSSLVGLGFTNAPASIAPFGGLTPLFGTNPIACAIPDGKGHAAVVVDQSSSVVAKSELIVHKANRETIPEGWALDARGQSTTDPGEGLEGSMVPAGGYKGAGLALVVELMAAVLTGATLSKNASSFADNKGGHPRTGQFFIAIDPAPYSGDLFYEQLEELLQAILSQQGARIPGSGRFAARDRIARDGIYIAAALHDRIRSYC